MDILKKIENLTLHHDHISSEVIKEKDVKLGLRNPDGTGVIVGITTKGRVEGYEREIIDRETRTYRKKPIEGRLLYCNYDVMKIVNSLERDRRFGFEETAYLLLTGELPVKGDLDKFEKELAKRRRLTLAERRIIMEEVENENQMFALHSVISHMSRSDPKSDSTDINDVSRQSLNLIAKFPTVVAHNYSVMKFSKGFDLKIVRPKNDMGTAENFLYMLKGKMPDPEEARLFDQMLILHAEHGGGNNSTFSVRVVSSSGANTYMAIAAGIASLSGYLHGGANESVTLMMDDMKKSVKHWDKEKQIRSYLMSLLERKAGDKSGKIYGFGHAVYTISDPRAEFLRERAGIMAKNLGYEDEFNLYLTVEQLGKKLLTEKKNSVICSNVDFYSGFIYKMMGIPRELYTPIFAMARVVGWCAHRIEQIVQGKIIRPAYIPVTNEEKAYKSLSRR